jgi:hypothetical protein
MTNKPIMITAALALLLVIAGVIGFAVHSGGGNQAVATPSPATVRGADVVETYPSHFVAGINIGARYNQNVSLTIVNGQNQVSWLNNTGQTVYVKDGQATLIATTSTNIALGVIPSASTTLQLFIGTTSAATISDNKLPPSRNLIDTAVIGTSSTNALILNSYNNKGTEGVQIMPVAPGQYVYVAIESPTYPTDGIVIGRIATSTDRGYNLNFSFNVFSLNGDAAQF